MQIKSYNAGLMGGIGKALRSLDEQVAEDLRKGKKIHKFKDKYYLLKGDREIITRVVVYS